MGARRKTAIEWRRRPDGRTFEFIITMNAATAAQLELLLLQATTCPERLRAIGYALSRLRTSMQYLREAKADTE